MALEAVLQRAATPAVALAALQKALRGASPEDGMPEAAGGGRAGEIAAAAGAMAAGPARKHHVVADG